MKNKLFITLLSTLLITGNVHAQITNQPTQAVTQLANKQRSLLDELNKDATDAYQKVVEAMKLLKQDGKEKQAIKKLQKATGKFDLAIAANPKLKQAVIENTVSINAFITTPQIVEDTVDVAIDLLKKHQVQSAQALLYPLKDEMVVSTHYLPIATYPDAVKLATKYLVNGKKDDAIKTLETTLNTVVIKTAIIPLSLVRAENLVHQASLTNKEQKTKIQNLLSIAQQQLQVAKLMGYTTEENQAYENIAEQISKLQKEIKGDNAVEKIYKKIKKSFTDLLAKENKQTESKK